MMTITPVVGKNYIESENTGLWRRFPESSAASMQKVPYGDHAVRAKADSSGYTLRVKKGNKPIDVTAYLLKA